ncbi:fungal hydrophobin-domain-containing protein [Hygrophoropsis aurantiaca]|uniref:Fungal hydrophobin-domain-containing protein n=1 Tax=Hygrophoropsis aurantiaca TaxID=72124 RepID=A0ACB8A7E0_9AGAM|nr:fungal hydrophobin-domain-containing protein [Hygrophoropsis aurantiaca]
MFARTSALLLVPVFALAAAAMPADALAARGDSGSSQCNTGSIQCCTSATSASDPTTSLLLGLLGVVLGPVTGLIGLGCTPITVVGTGTGAVCNQEPVCCTGNTFNGLINIGCSPINLNL